MKATEQDIARAFIATVHSLPESDAAAACDAAIVALHTHGFGRSVRLFPRVVRDMLLKEEGMLSAQITTSTGDVGEMRGGLVSALETSLQKKVTLEERKDPSLLGGALLQVGDERFDFSVRGILRSMQSHLSSRSGSPRP